MKKNSQYYAKLPKKLQTFKNDFYKIFYHKKNRWFVPKKEKSWSELKRDVVKSVQDLEDAMTALEAFFQEPNHLFAETLTWMRESNTFYHLKRMKTKMKYQSQESIESLESNLDEMLEKKK